MKKEWSPEWKKSKQPRKQRKYRHNAPLHIRHKLVSAHLTPELRKRYGKRSLPVREGDEVEVMRGEEKGMRGKVREVDISQLKVYIEGIDVKKVDETEVPKTFRPSNLKIVNLNLDDKERGKTLERGKKPEETKKKKKKAQKKKPKKETKEKPSMKWKKKKLKKYAKKKDIKVKSSDTKKDILKKIKKKSNR